MENERVEHLGSKIKELSIEELFLQYVHYIQIKKARY
jgi:hypothetical protein